MLKFLLCGFGAAKLIHLEKNQKEKNSDPW